MQIGGGVLWSYPLTEFESTGTGTDGTCTGTDNTGIRSVGTGTGTEGTALTLILMILAQSYHIFTDGF